MSMKSINRKRWRAAAELFRLHALLETALVLMDGALQPLLKIKPFTLVFFEQEHFGMLFSRFDGLYQISRAGLDENTRVKYNLLMASNENLLKIATPKQRANPIKRSDCATIFEIFILDGRLASCPRIQILKN